MVECGNLAGECREEVDNQIRRQPDYFFIYYTVTINDQRLHRDKILGSKATRREALTWRGRLRRLWRSVSTSHPVDAHVLL